MKLSKLEKNLIKQAEKEYKKGNEEFAATILSQIKHVFSEDVVLTGLDLYVNNIIEKYGKNEAENTEN